MACDLIAELSLLVIDRSGLLPCCCCVAVPDSQHSISPSSEQSGTLR